MPESLLSTYLHFLRSPNLSDPPIATSRLNAAKSILRLYSVHLVALLFILVIIGQIPNATESNNLLEMLEGMPIWYLPVTAVIVVPFLEECIFRLPLRPFLFNLVLPASLIAWVVLSQTTGPATLLPAILAIAFLNIYISRQGKQPAKLQSFYNRFPLIIFYGIAIIFGVVHIGNYDSQMWPFLPVLVLPQVVIGLLLGFVRLRYGFIWAVLLHALHNGALLLPVTFVQLFGSSQFQANLTESIDMETLSRSDQIVAGAIGLYSVAGAVLCVVVAWKVVRQWVSEHHSSNR